MRKSLSKLALKSALTAALVIWPVALGENAGGEGLAGRMPLSYPSEGLAGVWQDLRQGGLPAPAALAAGVMLLLPFALSTLRFARRRSQG